MQNNQVLNLPTKYNRPIVNTVFKVTAPVLSPHFQSVLNTVSDMGAMVVGYDQPEQPLDLLTEAANNLGLTLGDDIHFAINCAAHELMDYVSTGGMNVAV